MNNDAVTIHSIYRFWTVFYKWRLKFFVTFLRTLTKKIIENILCIF